MKDIDHLLDKYWEVETSIEEEAALRRYFSGSNIDPKHQPYASLFAYQTILFSQTSKRPMPSRDQVAHPSQTGQVVTMRPLRWLINAAAVTLVLFAAVWLINSDGSASSDAIAQVTVYDEAAETEEAIAATREALAFLSNKLDKNSRTVRRHFKQAERANIFN